MKLVKSLLLGSAAGFVAMSGAQAADLPSTKAAPAEYVRVCSAYGAGFFYIPGTDTCLKIGGRARYEIQITERVNRNSNLIGHRTIGNVSLDARTPTPWGTLRTFVRLEMARRTGNLRSGTGFRALGGIEDNTGAQPFGGGRAQMMVYLDAAFIQWAGITAGRVGSFFEFACGGPVFIGFAGSCLGPTNALAYTATFGPGFSATLAIEDGQERRHYLQDGALIGAVPSTSPTGGYGGVATPDLVLSFDVNQPWGAIKIAGALHHVNPLAAFATSSSTYGFAVTAGVRINLPMLAPGDALWLEGVYADGASHYTHSGPLGWGFNGASVKTSSTYVTADAIRDPATGAIAKVKSYGLLAAMLHYWTPNLRSGFGVGYTRVNNPTVTAGAIADFNLLVAGANLIWSPVRQFDIGFEVNYTRLSGQAGQAGFGALPALQACAAIPGGCRTSDDIWTFRVRLQRDF